MPTPTPTQDEIDRAAVGEHVVQKEYDHSGLDTGARPIGAPPPELPEEPPPGADNTLPPERHGNRPDNELPPHAQPKAAEPSYYDLTRGETVERTVPRHEQGSNAVNRDD